MLLGSLLIGVLMLVLRACTYTLYTGQKIISTSMSITRSARDIGNTKEYGWMATSSVPFQSRNSKRMGYILADNTLGHFINKQIIFQNLALIQGMR